MNTPARRGRTARLMLIGVVVAACGDDPTAPDFDASLGIDLSAMVHTASGLYYQDLAEGAGDAARAGDVVQVGYSGWLATGRLFGSGSVQFTLGSGEVVPGFDEGVTGMRVGGERRLVIPPELAYGNRAVGPIPANATLVFEVTLEELR